MTKKIISVLTLVLVVLISMPTVTVNSLQNSKNSLPEIKADYERYYFLMPDGSNGPKGDDIFMFGEYAESWYNEYTDTAGVYWWGGNTTCDLPGYKAFHADAKNVYYYDVSKDVIGLIWHNYIFGKVDYESPEYQSSNQTYALYLDGDLYDYTDYPDGMRPYKNMIFVIDPDPYPWDFITEGKAPHFGQWFQYYGGGCYGSVKDGNYTNCIRDDHYDENQNHITGYLIIGDVDADGEISILDATEIQMVLAKIKPFFEDITTADVDGDGEISILDATAIQLDLARLL